MTMVKGIQTTHDELLPDNNDLVLQEDLDQVNMHDDHKSVLIMNNQTPDLADHLRMSGTEYL